MDWNEWADSNVGMMKKQRCFLEVATLLFSWSFVSVLEALSFGFSLVLGKLH